MTTQTSIYLPDELLAELIRRVPNPNEQSTLIVEALRYFFSTHKGRCEELDAINALADELNQEAEDVLDYQVMP
jgi:hypothetical protein